MVKLIPQTAFGDALPRRIGSVSLQEQNYGTITSLAPFAGKAAAVERALGQDLPAPNQRVSGILWVGPGQYLVFDQDLSAIGDIAAITDQSDALATLSLHGADAADILARLVPIDLRQSTFRIDQTARTLINHMTASVTRRGTDEFELMVMRSVAGTLVEEVSEAANHVSARHGRIKSDEQRE